MSDYEVTLVNDNSESNLPKPRGKVLTSCFSVYLSHLLNTRIGIHKLEIGRNSTFVSRVLKRVGVPRNQGIITGLID